MVQSIDRPIGERLQIAMFALGSFDRREEVRNDGFWNYGGFAAKSEFDLDYFPPMNVLWLSQNLT